MGSHWFLARTGPKIQASTSPTTMTAPAIIETNPQEMETLAALPFSIFLTLIAPLGEAVKGVLQAGHLTFLPTSSSLTLSRLPQLSHTTEMAMVIFSDDYSADSSRGARGN